MAKWSGMVGYILNEETYPGVIEEVSQDRPYRGDLLQNVVRTQSGDQVNDDITIGNSISIVADPFAFENFHAIRYVTFMKSKWKVSSVEVRYPRLILSLGGVYNG